MEEKVTDFNSLAAIAKRVKQYHADRLAASKNILDHAIKAGAELLRAKSQQKHGEWLGWLKDQCELSERSAQDYMRVAAHREELKSADTADLGLAGALRLLKANKSGEPPGELSKYYKAQTTLLKKLEKLSPEDRDQAAQKTIQDLQNAVAALKTAQAA
jgi:Protein of unknown function (DUF3102)